MANYRGWRFNCKEPADSSTETVLKSISLKQFSDKLFGGFEGRDVRIEFSNLGTLVRIIPTE